MTEAFNKNAELKRRRRNRRIRKRIKRILFIAVSLALIIALTLMCVKIIKTVKSSLDDSGHELSKFDFESIQLPDYVDEQLISVGNARTGQKLDRISGIVIHYVGNPSTTAQNNRDYFNKVDTEVCSHFVVGLEGEIIQCLPLDERSAASNNRNSDTFSIEVCHPDETGKFNTATYNSLIKLIAWLCDTFKLDDNKVIRHYDVTGKECPLYYVNNPDKWDDLIKDVKKLLK